LDKLKNGIAKALELLSRDVKDVEEAEREDFVDAFLKELFYGELDKDLMEVIRMSRDGRRHDIKVLKMSDKGYSALRNMKAALKRKGYRVRSWADMFELLALKWEKMVEREEWL